MKSNIAVTTSRATTTSSKGALNTVNITNQEYVGDFTFVAGDKPTPFVNGLTSINGTAAAGAANVLYINPGNSKLFPWLSTVATQYETYRFEYLRFELRTTAGEYGNSGGVALGSVGLVVNYDVLNSVFTSSKGMLNYDGCVTAKPSMNMAIMVDHQRSMVPLNHLYIDTVDKDTGLPLTTGDKRFSYMGWIQGAAMNVPPPAGATATTNLTTHQVWVTYSVKLLQPKLVQT